MATNARTYPGKAYWQTETPQEADTGKTRVSYYAQAGKLQISQLYKDRDSGELRRGKTVTLDQEDMTLYPEALALIAGVLSEWHEA